MRDCGRRTFLKAAAAAGAWPLFNLGCVSKPLAERKARIALVGCGNRMDYGLVPDLVGEEIVAMCDPDPAMMRRRLATLGNLGYDVASVRHFFADYREMFDRISGELDAVVIAAPNHHHALPAILAMRRGLHVYVEKPMANTIDEVRAMVREAKRAGVVTQVGNQGHSGGTCPLLAETIRSGEMGAVTDVWVLDDRLNAMTYRPPPSPPPAGMDWDLWCGGSPRIDYYAAVAGKHGALHPHDFHSWIGYGNGSIGNMGTHLLDMPFYALKLAERAPSEIALLDYMPGCEGSWGCRDTIEWKFPAGAGMPAVTFHWFDGVKDGVPYDQEHVDRIGICRRREYQNVPPRLAEIEKRHGAAFGQLGSLVETEKGVLWSKHVDGTVTQILPKSLKKDLKAAKIPKTLPRAPGFNHVRDFLDACRTGRKAGCDFVDFGGPLAEMVLQGNVVARAGKGVYHWQNGRFAEDAANAFLGKAYRAGWEVA
ncbi:MAG: Gfo/Idh/MocA family oxidoreductase [Kiritimatiellae bacterium]|nr:Gfo/Idh/MocA family oxidoreductase [Kiritimatiellia bacterium]